MLPRTKRILRITLITVGILAVVAVAGSRIASHYLHQWLQQKFAAQNGTYASIDVSLLRRSVSVDSLSWILPAPAKADSSYKLFVENISISGIGLWSLWRNGRIDVGTVHLNQGRLVPVLKPTPFEDTTTHPVDSTAKKTKFPEITIGHLAIGNLYVRSRPDTTTNLSFTTSLDTYDLAIKAPLNIESLLVQLLHTAKLSVHNVVLTNRFYRCTVASLSAHGKKNTIDFEIDSTRLQPLHSKYAFSREAGRQTDRFTLFVPKVTLAGLSYAITHDSLFVAKRITINSPSLHAYRDKRVPFRKKKNTPLPMAMIRAFDMGFAVDSILVRNASITYEEFPEKGFHPGHIDFKALNATVAHVANRPYYTGRKHATVKAQAMLMGKGRMRCTFTLPYDEKLPYHAEGTVSAFPLYYINPALENMAFLSIESGQLNTLQFSFDYNDLKSNGTLLLNYKDLRIIGLTKERESSMNKLKTWLINTFLKDDKDRSVSQDRRTGVIEFDRDRKRAIFNFWWKSLLSGLKSSVLEATFQKEKKKK